MNVKKISQQLVKATKHLGISHSACAEIVIELQPYFKHEIDVFYQMGDGFVVCWETNDFKLAPYNVPVQDVIENIRKDKTTYLN